MKMNEKKKGEYMSVFVCVCVCVCVCMCVCKGQIKVPSKK